MTIADQNRLAEGLGKIAQKYDLLLQTCGTNGDFTRFGINTSGCMTLDILGQANGVTFRKLKHQGMREGCHCMASRDMGAYDFCMNGYRYCYANSNSRKAFENYKRHDLDSPLLLGQLTSTDVVTQGEQKSFLLDTTPSLF